MDIKEFIRRYKIILFLSFLIVVLFFLKIKYGSFDKNNTPEIIPTATPIPTVSFTEKYPEEMMEISE